MNEIARLRAELDTLIANLPHTLLIEINSIVDDIEARKWDEGWDARAAAYQNDRG